MPLKKSSCLQHNVLLKCLTVLLLTCISTVILSAAVVDYDFEVTVVDRKGEPLIGVNVFTDDQKFTGFTDINGKVVLSDISYNEAINFSYVGYSKKRLPFFELRKRGGRVILYEEENLIEEIVVIGRRDEVAEDIPYEVQNVTRQQIALTNSQTSADILRDHANVFVQKSQMGGGSPIIRGFEANRVLLVLDGVRMNNAIYRNGHLQNSISVDASILERAEVIYGPGSLIYGSDALGGVVHYRTRDPKLHLSNDGNDYFSELNFLTRYASANTEKTVHANLSYGKKKWGTLTSLSFTDYDDLRAGSKRPDGLEDFGKRFFYQSRDNDINADISNPNLAITSRGDTVTNYNLQVGTAYWQADFLQKVKFQPKENLQFTANLQYSTTSNIPRYDNLNDISYKPSEGTGFSRQRNLKWSDWFYGPQKRFLTSLRTQISNKTFFDKTTIIASYQNILEERVKRKFNRSSYSFGVEKVKVYTLTADVDKAYGETKRHKLSYGLDLSYNDVRSRAGKTDISTEEQRIGGELSRYPLQGSSMTQGGAYTTYNWKTSDSLLIFNTGVRYSFVSLSSVFSPNDPIHWPTEWTSGKGIQSLNTDLTFGASMTLNTRKKWQVRLLTSKAFRSPNIDDFAKIREKNGFVTIPNPELKPEKAYTGELTIAKDFGDFKNPNYRAFKVSATGFYTYLKDAISRRNAPLPDPTGTIPYEERFFLAEYDTLVSTGQIDTTKYVTQANLNAENGYVLGFSGNVMLRLNRNFEIKASINQTLGRISYRDSIYNFNQDTQQEEFIAKLDTLVPLDHIPPTYGQIGLTYKTDKLKLAFVTRFVGAKKVKDYAINAFFYNQTKERIDFDRSGSTDNIDEGPTDYTFDPETNEIISEEYLGTYAYTLLNLYADWQFSERFSLNLAVENIMDTHYRPFASGVSGAGRNFIIALRGKF